MDGGDRVDAVLRLQAAKDGRIGIDKVQLVVLHRRVRGREVKIDIHKRDVQRCAKGWTDERAQPGNVSARLPRNPVGQGAPLFRYVWKSGLN